MDEWALKLTVTVDPYDSFSACTETTEVGIKSSTVSLGKSRDSNIVVKTVAHSFKGL